MVSYAFYLAVLIRQAAVKCGCVVSCLLQPLYSPCTLPYSCTRNKCENAMLTRGVVEHENTYIIILLLILIELILNKNFDFYKKKNKY